MYHILVVDDEKLMRPESQCERHFWTSRSHVLWRSQQGAARTGKGSDSGTASGRFPYDRSVCPHSSSFLLTVTLDHLSFHAISKTVFLFCIFILASILFV